LSDCFAEGDDFGFSPHSPHPPRPAGRGGANSHMWPVNLAPSVINIPGFVIDKFDLFFICKAKDLSRKVNIQHPTIS
jgi:hypothetical protein